MDQHVPVQIADGLRRRGIDVITAFEDGQAKSDDDLLLARATELNRVLFTQDRDFLRIADLWQAKGRAFTGIIYAHQLTITIGQAVRDLELMAQVFIAVDMVNRVEYIPL